MTRSEKQNLKVRILKLAALKSTGSPADLAVRFEISERSVKRIIREIREEGNEIRYSSARRSYVIGEEYQ
ncbi:MAG: helix-turn-helix domain-containing protein [Bacteroidales bacterium]|nr:helix-turn-helix domain-containing protein [Bacteroidales bacterium]